MEPRANAASQSDSPATGAATFPAQHTTIGIGIRSSCCSFLATQTMVCSKMKDKIWQKARDKKHFIRDEIYWWQRERTLVGHAHILWVLLSACSSSICACAQVIRVAHSGWRSSCYVADALLGILLFWWFHLLFLLAVRCLLQIFCCIWSFLSIFLFWCNPVGCVLGFHCSFHRTCIVGCSNTVFCSFLSPLA